MRLRRYPDRNWSGIAAGRVLVLRSCQPSEKKLNRLRLKLARRRFLFGVARLEFTTESTEWMGRGRNPGGRYRGIPSVVPKKCIHLSPLKGLDRQLQATQR